MGHGEHGERGERPPPATARHSANLQPRHHFPRERSLVPKQRRNPYPFPAPALPPELRARSAPDTSDPLASRQENYFTVGHAARFSARRGEEGGNRGAIREATVDGRRRRGNEPSLAGRPIKKPRARRSDRSDSQPPEIEKSKRNQPWTDGNSSRATRGSRRQSAIPVAMGHSRPQRHLSPGPGQRCGRGARRAPALAPALGPGGARPRPPRRMGKGRYGPAMHLAAIKQPSRHGGHGRPCQRCHRLALPRSPG